MVKSFLFPAGIYDYLTQREETIEYGLKMQYWQQTETHNMITARNA